MTGDLTGGGSLGQRPREDEDRDGGCFHESRRPGTARTWAHGVDSPSQPRKAPPGDTLTSQDCENMILLSQPLSQWYSLRQPQEADTGSTSRAARDLFRIFRASREAGCFLPALLERSAVFIRVAVPVFAFSAPVRDSPRGSLYPLVTSLGPLIT